MKNKLSHGAPVNGRVVRFGASALVLMSVGVVGIGVLGGCRGERSEDPPRQFFPDMDDAPKWKPQSQSQFFEDGRTMRPTVPGTVPYGERYSDTREERAHYLREDRGYYEGVDIALWTAAQAEYDAQQATPGATTGAPVGGATTPEGASSTSPGGTSPTADPHAGHAHAQPAAAAAPSAATAPAPFPGQTDVYLAYMPIDPDEKLITRGRDRFNIYCATCHGFRGEGSVPDQFGSTVGIRWSAPVPSYHDPKYRDRALRTGKDGYLFHVARHGIANADPAKPPTMPAYGHALSEEETWAVVAYIRVLQAMWTEDLNSVPMNEVKGDRPAPPAPAAAPAASVGAPASPAAAPAAPAATPPAAPATPPANTQPGAQPGGAQ